MLFGMIKSAVQDAVYMMTGVKPWTGSNRSNWVTIEKIIGGSSDGGSPGGRDNYTDEWSEKYADKLYSDSLKGWKNQGKHKL